MTCGSQGNAGQHLSAIQRWSNGATFTDSDWSEIGDTDARTEASLEEFVDALRPTDILAFPHRSEGREARIEEAS